VIYCIFLQHESLGLGLRAVCFSFNECSGKFGILDSAGIKNIFSSFVNKVFENGVCAQVRVQLVMAISQSEEVSLPIVFH